jgi:ATP-dependent DNA helicase RecQ
LESVLPPSASPTVSAPEPILAARVDRLRSIRRRLAAEHGVPAYVVFSDATLRALARSCPSTLAQIAAVPGLGAVKVTAFGDAILAAVRET